MSRPWNARSTRRRSPSLSRSSLTKEEILEVYLNTVYFGAGAYGVQAAAEIYWDKDASDLGWAEGAMLAAVISFPDSYDPTRNPQTARFQRSIVMRRLVEVGHLTQEEADELNATPIPGQRYEVEQADRDYFVEETRRRLEQLTVLGDTVEERQEALDRGGLRIFTTLNPIAQGQMEEAITNNLPTHPNFTMTMAMASVEPRYGRGPGHRGRSRIRQVSVQYRDAGR